jgi:hypothetical protein
MLIKSEGHVSLIESPMQFFYNFWVRMNYLTVIFNKKFLRNAWLSKQLFLKQNICWSSLGGTTSCWQRFGSLIVLTHLLPGISLGWPKLHSTKTGYISVF